MAGLCSLGVLGYLEPFFDFLAHDSRRGSPGDLPHVAGILI